MLQSLQVNIVISYKKIFDNLTFMVSHDLKDFNRNSQTMEKKEKKEKKNF